MVSIVMESSNIFENTANQIRFHNAHVASVELIKDGGGGRDTEDPPAEEARVLSVL